MAATLTWAGVHTEDWDELAWHDGAVTQNCDTSIPMPYAAALTELDIRFEVTEALGNPVPTVTSSILATGFLRVAIANTAVAGNQMKWSMVIRRRHTATY